MKEFESLDGTEKQIAAFEHAAQQEFLAEKSARKKAENANRLKHMLRATGGAFMAVTGVCTARCGAALIGAAACVPKCLAHNSCKQDAAFPERRQNVPTEPRPADVRNTSSVPTEPHPADVRNTSSVPTEPHPVDVRQTPNNTSPTSPNSQEAPPPIPRMPSSCPYAELPVLSPDGKSCLPRTHFNNNRDSSSLPVFLKWIIPESIYASTSALISTTLGGLGSAKSVVTGIAGTYINRLANAPDVVKSGIVLGLAEIARRAAGQWNEAADKFHERGNKYQELADKFAATVKTLGKQKNGACQNGTSCDENNPCKDGSTCSPGNGGEQGACQDGTSCDENNPCKDGSTCSPGNGGEQGACQDGTSCDENNPCKDGSTCSPGNGGEQGACQDGTSCDENNPCKDGSTCSPGNGGEQGACQDGTSCDENNPCKDGSTCNGDGDNENNDDFIEYGGDVRSLSSKRTGSFGGRGRLGFSASQNNTDNGRYCATGLAGDISVTGNCDCRKNNSCARTSMPRVNFRTLGVKIPSSFESSYDAIRRGGDALYRGDGIAADRYFKNLDNNAAAVSKYNKYLFDNLKKKASKAKFNFPDQQDVDDRFLRSVGKFHSSLSPSAMGTFASAAGLGLGGSYSDDFGQDSEQKGEIRSSKAIKSSTRGMGQETDMSFLDGELSSEEAPPVGVEEFEEYKEKHHDIVEKPHVSLWRILSNRYITSFPLVLEKK